MTNDYLFWTFWILYYETWISFNHILVDCLKKDNKAVEKREFSEIETKLYELFENGACNINQIVNSLPFDRDKIIEVVRFLVDEGYIIYEEPIYRLK